MTKKKTRLRRTKVGNNNGRILGNNSGRMFYLNKTTKLRRAHVLLRHT
jgi:hypothetical protein